MQSSIIKIEKLDFMFGVEDPFLFCAHHHDFYPEGNEDLGPTESGLIGRNIGNDFEVKDGWRMYHGEKVPGFPVHPHRGFETVTIVLEGFVDHSDSHGAYGRYGNGDVQWMTAGSGLQHAEMFPLVNQDKDNPLHLFQVWLNLPKKDKFTDPHYKMLWNEDIPIIENIDSNDRKTKVKLIAGRYKEVNSLEPSPASWAKDDKNNVNIWLINMEKGSEFKLPAVSDTISRNLYYYKGDSIEIDQATIDSNNRIKLRGNQDIIIKNANEESHFLLLEGEPIKEPVVSYGPFVMNTMEEIKQAYADYQETGFGGWPWETRDPVHSHEKTRFAKYANGFVEKR